MATLTIRNLDDDVKTRLRIRAAHHDRSMEEEARRILGDALGASNSESEAVGLGSRIHRRFAELGGVELEPPQRTEAPRTPEHFG